MNITQTRQQLLDDAKRLEQEAAQKKAAAESLVRKCQHSWDETRYTPDYQAAYTIPGDTPGTMGIDYRGPCHVPSKTTPRWSRTCKNCGVVETTTRIRQVGDVLKNEVPDFGDTTFQRRTW